MRTINIIGVGEVKLKKSRLAKRLILKIDSNGTPIVTMPNFTPYILGKKFALQNAAWIQKHIQNEKVDLITSGSLVGSEHSVVFKPRSADKISSRIQNSIITISYPEQLDISVTSIQAEAKKAAIRALKNEANDQLPALLHQIAEDFDLKYKSVSIKKMHSRWGSCSSKGEIALSIWLMQLPENLINYVLCHELAHLKHHNHKVEFWAEVESMVPDYKLLRKELKKYQPKLLLA